MRFAALHVVEFGLRDLGQGQGGLAKSRISQGYLQIYMYFTHKGRNLRPVSAKLTQRARARARGIGLGTGPRRWVFPITYIQVYLTIRVRTCGYARDKKFLGPFGKLNFHTFFQGDGSGSHWMTPGYGLHGRSGHICGQN